MKFGIRTPSISKRISARTSPKRIIRHKLGIKAPRGMGIVTNPKKALYNQVYRKTTVGLDKTSSNSKRKKVHPYHKKEMSIKQKDDGTIDCPKCKTNMGKPKLVRLINKKKVYKCPNCNIKAQVLSEKATKNN